MKEISAQVANYVIGNNHLCPACNGRISNGNNYCVHCGQKLSWEFVNRAEEKERQERYRHLDEEAKKHPRFIYEHKEGF